MPRIVGVNIPEKKQIRIALTYIYGIGPSLAKKILETSKISSQTPAYKLSKEQINLLKEIIEKKYKIEGDLKHERSTAIRRLKNIGCLKGIRHSKGLPVHGQRTKSNSRTVRGNVRKTVGSGRKPPPAPK